MVPGPPDRMAVFYGHQPQRSRYEIRFTYQQTMWIFFVGTSRKRVTWKFGGSFGGIFFLIISNLYNYKMLRIYSSPTFTIIITAGYIFRCDLLFFTFCTSVVILPPLYLHFLLHDTTMPLLGMEYGHGPIPFFLPTAMTVPPSPYPVLYRLSASS
jgi:hypothetical protein